MIPIPKWSSLPIGPAIRLILTRKRPLTLLTVTSLLARHLMSSTFFYILLTVLPEKNSDQSHIIG